MSAQAGETRLAITLGDPAGVGAEVALRAISMKPLPQARVLLIGDLAAAREAAKRAGLDVALEPIGRADLVRWARAGRRPLPVLDPARERNEPPLRPSERRPGRPSIAGARVAYRAIEAAVALAQAGEIDAIATAPISKDWFARAGVARTGHTEILAELTRAREVRLMMALPELRVVLATTHLALGDVPRALSVAVVRDTVAITASHLSRWWGIRRPRIAVAALNPHAGDGGVYGDEEEKVIGPAIRAARRRRLDAVGPVPADTLFSDLGPRCDAVVAMYHDQGLIPIKQLDVHRAVNVTLGLPFIRTSPDHGTAYDVAGTGRADPRSMRAAVTLALELATIEKRARKRSLGKRSR
jgi:4-hydroxythreonine-4-phosphate dehydrogenase